MTSEFGIDADGLASISPADLAAFQGGKQFCVGYLGSDDSGGYLRPAEAAALLAQGVSVVSVYETQGMSDTGPDGNYSNGWVSYFVPGQGAADAASAVAAAHKAGQTGGAIYFAIDLDPGAGVDAAGIAEPDALARIDEYFHEIRAYFSKVGAPYEIGVYGAGDTLTRIIGDSAVGARYSWLADASGWAGNATYTGETLQQYQNNLFSIDGVAVDLDKSSGSSFGQWTSSFPLSISDSAANVVRALSGLETLAAQGKLGAITLTDSGVPIIAVTAAQLAADRSTLEAIASGFVLSVTLSASDSTISAFVDHAAIVEIGGPSSQYGVAPVGDASSLILTGAGGTTRISGASALQFTDLSEIVASRAPPAAGSVSSLQITELYGAVFGREPDVAGLVYYASYETAHPGSLLQQFAQWFLASPEYTANPAHAYVGNTAGDVQFITASYQNLLHRTPAASEVTWYLSQVITPLLAGQSSGTGAYEAADIQAHAWVLTYFSQSPEFLGDVQVTAQHPADSQHWLVLV